MSGFTLGHWLVVGGLAWCVYRLIVGRVGKQRPTSHTTDTWRFDVVGESFYRENFNSLFPRAAADTELECQATLRLEDDNPHDDQAVGVHIHGLKVGHLSRSDARRFRASAGSRSKHYLVDAVVCTPAEEAESYSVSVFLCM